MKQEEIVNVFGNKLRVRVCGICIQENKILLVKHRSLGPKGVFWAPPGGGVDFGESIEDSLIREFKEETGFDIQVEEFLFIYEFIEKPLHAIELFFSVKITSGNLIAGSDPEMSKDNQIIESVKFISIEEIKQDRSLFHGIFKSINKLSELTDKKSYLKLEKL